MTTKTERIRALNDQLRTTGQGGQIVLTRGIANLSLESRIAISRQYNHSTASLPTTTLMVNTISVYWKSTISASCSKLITMIG
jgi:hypothetical protein